MQTESRLVSKNQKKKNRLSFLFFWILAHVIGGTIAFNVGDELIRLNLLGRFSVVLATIAFESILWYSKSLVFRRYQIPMLSLVKAIDMMSHVSGAGLVVFLKIGQVEGMNNFSPISFSLIKWGGVFSFFWVAVAQFRYSGYLSGLKKKMFFDKSQIRDFVDGRPLLGTILYPSTFFIKLIFHLVIALSLFLGVVAIIFVFLYPLEYFNAIFQNAPALTKNFFFSISSVGWVGLITGIFYATLPHEDVRFWRKLEHQK